MKPPNTPDNEADRLSSLRSLRILDTPAEERFDRITRIARSYFNVPIALVSLVDSQRQWFKSRQGLKASETPRDISFCGHAILDEQTFVVSDALENSDFADNPLVCGHPKIRFYAGAPLHAPDRARIGTLCIIDDKPRELNEDNLGVLRDLADCVEMEIALSEVLEHQHFLLEISNATPGLIAYWDKELVCRFANRPYLEWFGKSPDAVIGSTLQDLLGPRLFALNEPYVRGALAGEVQRFERVLTKADGSIRHTWAVYAPDKNRDGAVAGFIVLVTDVTPLKEAERKVKEAEQRLQSILDNVQDGIVTLNEQGRIVSANRAMANIFDYAIDDMVGRHMATLIPDFGTDNSKRADDTDVRRNLTGRNKIGREFPIELSASAMVVGERTQLVGVVRDITERVEATKALDKARKVAEAANAAKDRFLAIVSHEIRTPITAVLGMAGLLLDSGLSSEQQEWLLTLTRSTQTLLGLVDDILDFSKIEAGAIELDSVDFSLATLVKDACSLFLPLASERANVVEVDVDSDAVCRGDAKKYRQVLINLVGNANKFTSGGKISVIVRSRPSADGRIVVETHVCDTGIGIAATDRSRLFQPFVQEDISTSRKFGGTGLGLSICKTFVELMGGTIGVESQGGRGSDFGFTVVLDRGDLTNIKESGGPQVVPVTVPSTHQLHVLIAEDNDSIRMLLSTVLTRKGHEVTAVNNGAAAVEAYRAANFDLVLMDMQMPVMDGMNAMRIIRQEESPLAHIPIIALTADALKENQKTYLAAGADRVVSKPVDWARLFEDMERLTTAPDARELRG